MCKEWNIASAIRLREKKNVVLNLSFSKPRTLRILAKRKPICMKYDRNTKKRVARYSYLPLLTHWGFFVFFLFLVPIRHVLYKYDLLMGVSFHHYIGRFAYVIVSAVKSGPCSRKLIYVRSIAIGDSPEAHCYLAIHSKRFWIV